MHSCHFKPYIYTVFGKVCPLRSEMVDILVIYYLESGCGNLSPIDYFDCEEGLYSMVTIIGVSGVVTILAYM